MTYAAKPYRMVVAVGLLVVSVGTAQAEQLSFEERLRTQRALEAVGWHHRIWPADNPTPKPAFDTVISESVVGAKVEETLARSEALSRFFSRPITAAELQAEIERMAAATRDPERLRELFAAAGNDAERIAECIARPALADRLLRNLYAGDNRFHAEIREKAESALRLAAQPEDLIGLDAEYHETEWLLARGAEGMPPIEDDSRSSRRVETGPEWDRIVARVSGWLGSESLPRVDGAARHPSGGLETGERLRRMPVGRVSRLLESEEAFFVVAVLGKSDEGLRLASASWRKRPFDAWWSEVRSALLPARALSLDAAATPDEPYSLPAIAEASCTDDTWSSIRAGNVPEERDSHTAVWTGTEMIVWGGAGPLGALRSGGRYNPATDTWTPVSQGVNAPTARWRHTAVWTGTEMIVWGGSDGLGYLQTGGRYAPAADTWSPTSIAAGVPVGRESHTAVWTGTEMIVWGGDEYLLNLSSGGRYNPATDRWRTTATGGSCPSDRYLHSAVWTGTRMIVWGGLNDDLGLTATGGQYDPVGDSWTPTSLGAGVPTPRSRHTAVWSGTEMIVWGGSSTAGYVNSGARYRPGTDSWTPTSVSANVPEPRYLHTAVWTGSRMIVWGGYLVSGYTNTGGRYDPSGNAWTATSASAPTPSARGYHTAIWSGTEMIVWGGYRFDGADQTLESGGRYDPSQDRWIPTSAWADRRRRHTAVWTGAEIIVWGGESTHAVGSPTALASGGRYDPATDHWSSTEMGPSAPSARERHTAVWSGTEVIIWGGRNGPDEMNTGGRYDPAQDRWTPVSTGANLPTPRYLHTAVWTGTQMIVWGGWDGLAASATGGRYTPAGDSWTPVAAGPSGRYAHTAVWSGSRMIVWGGTGTGYTNTGSRYEPSANSWSPTSTGTDVPTARAYHTAVWTGSQMIVWGGTGGEEVATGGRYDPAGDGWTKTSTGAGVPERRAHHTAVWTGSTMIVWGGSWNDATRHPVNTGARYAPGTDSWTPTSTGGGVPTPRDEHTAVWTGSEMILWGGQDATASAGSGGRYCASSCSLPAPSGTPRATVDRSGSTAVINWPPLAGATAYDAIKGALGTLRSTSGDFAASTTACLANDTAATTVSDAAVPGSGAGFWYLVRGVSCGGNGTYDCGYPSQSGYRDTEIEASAAACP